MTGLDTVPLVQADAASPLGQYETVNVVLAATSPVTLSWMLFEVGVVTLILESLTAILKYFPDLIMVSISLS